MHIDLNDPEEPNFESVKKLIAAQDDSQPRQLRIKKTGIAYFSDLVGADEIEDLACRFETLDPGNGYTGKAASEDKEWVDKVLELLTENWPTPKSTYIDY